MSFSFQRPVGSIADVAELEYVSALHQTDVQGGIRQDGSIQGENKEFPLFDAVDAIATTNDVFFGIPSVNHGAIESHFCFILLSSCKILI